MIVLGVVCAAPFIDLLERPGTPTQQERNSTQELETAETAPPTLAEERMLDASRNTMKQKSRRDRFVDPSRLPRTISYGNYNARLVLQKSYQDKAVYRVNSEAGTYPIEFSIDKQTGSVSLLEEHETEEMRRFFVGVVEDIVDDYLTLKVSDEQGVVRSISLSVDNTISRPSKGQRIFVATYLDSNRVTELEPLF